MSKTSEEYKRLTITEFTRAVRVYEKDNAGVYKICRKDYPDILRELEQEPFTDLLDAGCGPGSMIAILEEKIPGKHYTGIDLTPAMIEDARGKNLPDAEFVIGDCENLPFPDDRFDVILCSNSAHHYPDLEKFYQSVYRCLRPNGRLILRDFTSDSRIIRWLAAHLEMPLAHALGHGDVDMLHRDEVQRGLEAAGMKVEKNEIRKGGRLHLVARKPLHSSLSFPESDTGVREKQG